MSVDPMVFCIGLHRTGTTSFSAATEYLGYKSVHGVFKEMPGAMDLDHECYKVYNSFSDTPFYLNYRNLESSFPNARFVLTIRSEEGWVQSVLALIDACRRRYSVGHPVWTYFSMTYKSLDASALLWKYREHYKEVCEYFDGSDRLLVLHLETDCKWCKLCRFLNKEIPDVEFPHMHKRLELFKDNNETRDY